MEILSILPKKIQFCFLQQEQISSLKKQESYHGYVILGNLARQEVFWWIENIRLSSGRKIQQLEPQMTIQTDASTKGGEHIAKEFQQGGNGQKRKGTPHKCFRTNGCEICNLDFHKKSLNFNYSYSDGQESYPIVPLENGRYTHSLEFLKISKSIWHYLLFHGIIITAKYLPNKLNIQADWESRNSRMSSDWKLHQSMFQSVTKSNILDIQQ